MICTYCRTYYVEGERHGCARLPHEEFTGGSVNYYKVKIEHPTTPGAAPYTAECNDIIEALGMNYSEGNAFKAIWRICAARQGRQKKGYSSFYDAEKVEFFGHRMVEQQKGGSSA